MVNDVDQQTPRRDKDRLVDQAAFANPPLEADVVMKGGITSGIVYPRAVAYLAQNYRFRNVGGTSAGAIAAAAVAAAEKGRQTEDGGFAMLASLPDELGRGRPGDSRLLRLFQPDPKTARLFRLALSFLARGWKRGALSAFRLFPWFSLGALFLILLAVGLAVFGELEVGFAVAVCLAALGLAVVGTAVRVAREALTVIPENDFGLCRLFKESPDPGREPLTVWLEEQLQTLSGKPADSPLTFVDLWGIPDADELCDPETWIEVKRRFALPSKRSRPTKDQAPRVREELKKRLGWDVGTRKINLEVVTTDLTHGRPVRLPVPFQRGTTRPVEAPGLLFDPDELRRFFPDSVVRHMEASAEPVGAERAARLREINSSLRLCRFPIGADLPVVVAARMSLSFPILISAVPLWELDFDSGEERPPLKRVIFSDGGISSNFPVHFFDSIIPRRPTFGVSLSGFPPGERPDPSDQDRNVDPPPLVATRVPEHFREIQGLFGFATAIKDAMQNWRDNAQAGIPGFRERIVNVKLDKREGGLNLSMDQNRLMALSKRGERAGAALDERFAQPAREPGGRNSNWNRYRFARYRTAMCLIERVMRDADRGITAPVDAITVSYEELIAQGDSDGLSYQFHSKALREFAQQTTRTYGELVELWNGERASVTQTTDGRPKTLEDDNLPRPQPDLGIVPPV